MRRKAIFVALLIVVALACSGAALTPAIASKINTASNVDTANKPLSPPWWWWDYWFYCGGGGGGGRCHHLMI